ncbi:PaaI family thioesterase [Lentibacillus juripiscarius]|uniref:PaaI family thioesterase n=1 Tax=Lentibacillus juripiscarius TaxID=257446 RepID=A0ABW5V8H2_9BACI
MTNQIELAIQDDYPDDFAHCYGCGRLNQDGYQFRTGWDGGKTLTMYTPKPEHTAIPGFVYGGLIASLIDCHGTGSASLALHRKNGHEPGDGAEPPRFVTASLQVDFMKPTPQDVTLRAVGVPEEIHPKKFQVHTEVYAGDTVCAKAVVTAAVMPASFTSKK